MAAFCKRKCFEKKHFINIKIRSINSWPHSYSNTSIQEYKEPISTDILTLKPLRIDITFKVWTNCTLVISINAVWLVDTTCIGSDTSRNIIQGFVYLNAPFNTQFNRPYTHRWISSSASPPPVLVFCQVFAPHLPPFLCIKISLSCLLNAQQKFPKSGNIYFLGYWFTVTC